MKIRAVIFDLYGTLLEVGPPTVDPAALWAATWPAALGPTPRLSLREFSGACERTIAAEHAAARARGIAFPEVFWPDVVDAVLPEFTRLPPAVRADLPAYDARLGHSVRLMPGAAETLRIARAAALPLGLASNCQPYTLRELDAALASAGLDRDLFDPHLTFLSFAHGFSKPDPHVFRLLSARLRTHGITPAETLMVGDRPDNDLVPARAQGWQAFAIAPAPSDCWSLLRDRLGANPSPGDTPRSQSVTQ